MAVWQEMMRPAADNWECSDEKVHALIHLMTGMWFGEADSEEKSH